MSQLSFCIPWYNSNTDKFTCKAITTAVDQDGRFGSVKVYIPKKESNIIFGLHEEDEKLCVVVQT